jgi:O-antigen/teichoic acid export membrane protein
MEKNKIRLQYSGLILFSSKLLSVATGLLFTLMLTRILTRKEFGIWGNINDLTIYFLLTANIVPFWVTRFVARKHEGAAKTGIVANLLLSLISTVVYLVMIPLITSSLHISSKYLILYVIVALQIIELYTLLALQSVIHATQPQAVGYSLLIHEIAKIIVAYMLIIHFKTGLLGALISLILAYLIRILFYLRLIGRYLKEEIRWSYFKEWIKASPINIYNIIGTQISTFALIFLFVYGTEVARAYYGASFQIAMVINYSSFLAFALYPKLLSNVNQKEVTKSLNLVLRFAIPLTIGAIVLADSYLTVLSKVYAEAVLVLQLIALSTLFITLSQFLNNIILGVEKIDEKSKIPFKQLIKSRLFQIFTLSYVRSAIILPSSFFVLTTIAQTPLQAAIYTSAIFLIANLTILICRYVIAKKSLHFGIPWKSLGKYLVASTVMATLLVFIPHPKRLLATLAVTLLGGITYITILLTIDKDTRDMVRLTIQEIRNKILKISVW